MASTFTNFVHKVNRVKNVPTFVGRLLALDPGETTGFAQFDVTPGDATIHGQGQLKTYPLQAAVASLTNLLDTYHPTQVVFESYRIYEWKADGHSWSDVPTLRIIGCLETLCIQRSIPYCSQTAQEAKNFCTDDKLKEWLLYEKGQRHARDACRHGAYYLMFGKSGQPQK